MEDGVEMDCCPIASRDQRHQVFELGANLKTKAFDERFDSAYSSYGCSSADTESCESGNLPSEIREGRPLHSEENPIPVLNFQNLSINHEKILKEKERGRPDCEDEGFYSQDLGDKPLDLSTKRPELREKSAKKTQDQEQVSLEEFIQHVTETFQQDDDGDTRLHTAIIQIFVDFALYCISLAPNPNFLNIKNNFQQTPLHLAAITKQPQIARKLITSGAQIDARDHKGNSPLHIAAKEGHADVAKVLLEPIKHSETVDNAYEIPYQAIPQNLEARNYDGQVCLHLAAEHCHIELLQLLLQMGADINTRDGKSGRTVLHYAAESGNMELLRFLLERSKIDVNAVTYSRLTPIMLAKGRGNIEAVRLLKENGAVYEADESEEEDMVEDPYDDFKDCKINGHPINVN